MPANNFTSAVARQPNGFIRLYRLVCKDSGLPYGHALPMLAAVRAKDCAEKMGKPTGIERVQ